jgi:hypothetical protein
VIRKYASGVATPSLGSSVLMADNELFYISGSLALLCGEACEAVMGYSTGPFPASGLPGNHSHFMGQILKGGTEIEVPFKGTFTPGTGQEWSVFPWTLTVPMDFLQFPSTSAAPASGSNPDLTRSGITLTASGTSAQNIFQLIEVTRNGLSAINAAGLVTGQSPDDKRCWVKLLGSACQDGSA